jgi:hypothetical protein
MPNRIEARSAKAALTNATGRLPLLRLFSTPLNAVMVGVSVVRGAKAVIKVVHALSSLRGGPSFTTEKADSPGEGAAVVNAVGKEVGGVVVIVDEDPVFSAGHVVEAAANRPVVAERVESLLHMRV